MADIDADFAAFAAEIESLAAASAQAESSGDKQNGTKDSTKTNTTPSDTNPPAAKKARMQSVPAAPVVAASAPAQPSSKPPPPVYKPAERPKPTPAAVPKPAAIARSGGVAAAAGGTAPRPARPAAPRNTVRVVAGQVWNDPTLAAWPEGDFRIHCGQLGNEVDDTVLAEAFSHYKSFARARAVRKRDGKAAGYGFVSFTDPMEGVKALREMQGKWVGQRPLKLTKSTWQDRAKGANAKTQATLVRTAKRAFKGTKRRRG